MMSRITLKTISNFPLQPCYRRRVMLEFTLLSLLCSSKNDVTFKITIKLVIDHY
jgi:hypothetical protein